MTAHKPHDRVAGTRPGFIHEVDAVPSTHTEGGWVHAWTVTDRPGTPPPHTFAAKPPIPAAVAVTAMCATVLTATVTALAAITNGHDANRTITVCLAALGLWTAALAVPALIRRQPTSTGGSGSDFDEQPRWSTDQTRQTIQTGDEDDQNRREANGTDARTGENASVEERHRTVEERLTRSRAEYANDSDRVETSALVLGRAETPWGTEAVGESVSGSRKAEGAAVGGVEDRPLGNGETSSPHEQRRTSWQ